jgi:hypothetical protein
MTNHQTKKSLQRAGMKSNEQEPLSVAFALILNRDNG